ncbi:MAG: MFS transporter [Oscillospiraceae bacterium]|nr:MFS transporter [Oscillospiraceae bacterium]
MKKRNKDDYSFTKNGESLVVAGFHKQFAILELFFGLMNGATMFNVVFLKYSGLSATQVGGFVSIASLIGMFAPMFWSVMSDKYHTIKKIIYITLICMMVVYVPIPLYSKLMIGSLSLAPFLIILQAAFAGTPEGMVTTWIMQTQRQHPDVQYGFIRMFFTAAFSLSNFVYMFIIEKTSINSVFIGYGLFAVIIMITLSRYSDENAKSSESNRKSLGDMQIGQILKNPRIITYIIFMMFACIPSSSLGLFTPYLIEEVGADASLLGGMVAIRSLIAVPILYFSSRFIRRLRPQNTLVIGSSLFCLSQLIFVFCQTITQVTLNCAFMGVALGIMMPSEIAFINEQAPEGLLATCQTVCGTVYSLAGILCSFLGGIVVDRLGIRRYYLFVVILTAAASIFFWISSSVIDKRKAVVDEI